MFIMISVTPNEQHNESSISVDSVDSDFWLWFKQLQNEFNKLRSVCLINYQEPYKK